MNEAWSFGPQANDENGGKCCASAKKAQALFRGYAIPSEWSTKPKVIQKRGSRKLVGLVPGSRHLASNPCVTASAFIAMNPEALPPPHSICFNATSRSESPDPEQPQTGAGLGGPRLGSLDCEHVFDRLLPTVERNIKEATVRLAGRRAIIIRWWIEDRDSWNQRPCSKSRLAVPPAGGICTPVTMT